MSTYIYIAQNKKSSDAPVCQISKVKEVNSFECY